MAYYKVIEGGSFVGVATSDEFRKLQAKHRVIVKCDEDSAQFIQIGEELYRDDWFAPTDEEVEYHIAKITNIEKDEYDALYQAVESGQEIEINNEEILQEEPVEINPEDEVTIEYVRDMKIAEMRRACEATIMNGIDVQLSDGEAHHFSLAITDQLNLLTLSAMAAEGNNMIPYHADGELCKYYSAADINTIVNMATIHKTYNTTYFNALQGYIKDMDDMTAISEIYYGIEIPQEYRSEILNDMLNG